MPAPGAPKGMGGMSPPGGEVPDEVAQMMGGSSSSGSSSSGSNSSGNPLAGGGNTSGGKISPAQMAAAQQSMGGAGSLPGSEGNGMDAVQAAQANKQPPREVGTIKDEVKRGVSDLFTGIKEFFSINTWLGIRPDNMDPKQQAQAKQLHSRYQQLNQEQQMVAKRMFEEKMQKKKMEEEETARKRQMEADQQAQSVEMPSGPQKGAKGQGGSKKQRTMTKLKQDRTTLSTTQGE